MEMTDRIRYRIDLTEMQRHPRGRHTWRVDRYDVCVEQAVLGKAVITLHTRIANVFLVFLLLVLHDRFSLSYLWRHVEFAQRTCVRLPWSTKTFLQDEHLSPCCFFRCLRKALALGNVT